MNLLAIDPGKQGLAFALFRGTTLVSGGVHALRGTLADQCEQAAAGARSIARAQPVQSLTATVEEMVHYPKPGMTTREQSAKIRDLLRLQAIGSAAAWASGAWAVTYRPPASWKGQISKSLCQERIAKRLSPEELARAQTIAKRYGARGHNLWDAIGLGLVELGRM